MYFSPQGEKIPKELLRLRLKLPCFCWEAYTHGSQQTEPRTCVRSPSFAVREVTAAGKPAPAGARRAPCERPPARCLRKGRLTDHASFASVDAVFHSRHRTAASRTNDRTERSRLLFVLFLYGQEKNTFLLSKGEKIFKYKKTAIFAVFCFIHKPIVL